jgi:hypothetical protein
VSLSQDKNVPASGPPYSYGGTPKDRTAAAMVTLTLAHLVQLSSNSHFMPLIESFNLFMHTEFETNQVRPAISVVQNALEKVAQTYTGLSASSVQIFHMTPTDPELASVNDTNQHNLQHDSLESDAPLLHSRSVTYQGCRITLLKELTSMRPP